MTTDARAHRWALLVACARHAAGVANAAEVGAAAAGIEDWEEVVPRARAHGLLPWLARAITAAGLAHGARMTVIDAASGEAARTLGQVRRLGELCALLEGAGVRVLPYKGPTLSFQLYGDLALRHSVDLDLVVPFDDYARARDVLVRRGLPPRRGYSERQERTLFAALGHAPFGNGDEFVELHWRFADRRFPFALSAEGALERAQPTIVGGRRLPLMSHDDLVVVLAMHGTRHLYERLEWLAGVTRLLRAAPDDAPRLMAHARSLHAERMLAVSVHMAERLLGLPIGDAWQRELSRDTTAPRLAERMTSELEAHELHDRPFLDGAALQRRYADLVDTRLDRARLYAHAVLAPTARDQEALALPDALAPLHRVLRPLRLVVTYLVRKLAPRHAA